MGAQSVKIPVELEIQKLQSEVARMRNLLGELKPNTKAFLDLEKRIDRVSHSLISLETRSKQTFSNQGEISNFSKAFDKVSLAIQDIYTEFQHLDFKDLQLSDANPGVQKLKNFGQQIENIQKKIKDIDFEILGDNNIIPQETLKTLKQLDPTFDATQTSIESCFQTLSQELKRVNGEITSSVKEVKKLEAAYDKAQEEHAKAAIVKGNLEADRRNAGNNVINAKSAKKNQDLAGARAIALQLQIEKKELDKVSESYLSSLTDEKRLQTINEFFDKVINRAELKNQELITLLNDATRRVNELEAKENEALKKWNDEDNRGRQLEAEKQSIQTAETNLKIGEQESINRVQAYITQIQNLTQRVQELEEQLRQNNTVTQQLNHLNEAQERLNNVQYGIKQWFGFHEVINLSKNAVRDAINHIRELDKVMTEIAVVTDMTQKDLWNQMNAYSTMAKEYASSIKGVYEVSQLWYQQGLQTNEVMKLTEETLKMVKIAGIDYSKATDYMTVALRGFKMEMEDAQRVVDVYSRIAAITASDTQELAEAMSKTASSAEAVGSSFENTTAMIALMVETTRESAQNIGSALKSIISRYGEMTTNPAKLVDSEGEEMSLNRVDKALKSVGITLQDANGQFRNFDEVILELSSKWDTIDKNTQRYIATIMAGNRQQSRFLALVGNYDRLSELYEEAADSQDAATLQQLKTLESIETKLNKVKVSLQSFYTDSGLENIVKWALDLLNGVIERFNNLPSLFGKFPASALIIIAQVISSIKKGGTQLVSITKGIFQEGEKTASEAGKVAGVNWISQVIQSIRAGKAELAATQAEVMGQPAATGQPADGFKFAPTTEEPTPSGSGGKVKFRDGVKQLWQQNVLGDKARIANIVSGIATYLGPALSAGLLSVQGDIGYAGSDLGQALSGLTSLTGGAARIWANPLDFGAWLSAANGLANLIDGFWPTAEERLKALEEREKKLKEEALVKKDEYDTLQKNIDNIDRLKESQYDSEEATQEYIDAMNALAETNPELITGFDNMGNAIIDTVNAEEILVEARKEAAEAAYKAAIAEGKTAAERAKQRQQDLEGVGGELLVEGRASYIKESLLEGPDVLDITENQKLEKVNRNNVIVNNDNVDEKLFTEEDDEGNRYLKENITRSQLEKLGVQIKNDNIDYTNLRSAVFTKGKTETLYNEEVAILEEIANFRTAIQEGYLTSEQASKTKQLITEFVEKNPFSMYSTELVGILDNWTEIIDGTGDFTKALKILSATNLKSISTKIEELTLGEQEFIEESAGLYSIMQNEIEKNFNEAEGYNEEEIERYLSNNEDNILKLAESYNQYWSLLSKSEQEAFNKIYENRANYTEAEYKDALLDLSLPQDILEQALIDYRSFSEAAQERFINKISLNDRISPYDETRILALEENLASGILDNVAKQFTDASKQNPAGISPLIDFYSSLNELGPEAERIASEADLSSLTGIHEMVLALKELGLEVSPDELLALQNSVIVNLETEYNTLVTTMGERIENMSDQLKLALEGMDLSEAMSFSEKWDINLSDLDFKEGKFFLDVGKNADLIKDYYMGQYEPLLNKLENETELIQNELIKNSSTINNRKIVSEEYFSDLEERFLNLDRKNMSQGLSDSEKELYESLRNEYYQSSGLSSELYSVYESYASEWEEMSDDEREGYGNDLASFLSAQLGIQRDEAQTAIEEYGNNMFNSALIASGRINEALKNILGEESKSSPDDIIKSFRKGDFKEFLGVDELDPYFEELYDKLANSLPEAWSDIVENLDGKKLIKVDDTNRDIYEDLDTQGIVEQISKDYYQVVAESQEDVVAAILKSGMGLEDINAQLLAVEEYYNSKATSKETQLSTLLDIIGDPTKVEISILETLANSLGITIEELKKYFAENLDGTYSTGIAQINYLINEFGLESSTEINDALREYLDNILGLISNGLSGSMTGLEAEELNNFIHQYNSDFNLQTVETAEGFKLTEKSAFEIYSTLKEINALAAKTMLSEMAENAMDADESLNDVHKVTKQILETEKQIIGLEGNQDGVKRLSAQLDLAKEIRQQLMMEGDAFNFMEQDRTTGESNPLSAWEGLGQAVEILDGDNFKAGYIDYTDLDNMISMMEQYGVNLSDVATSFNGEAVTAANLMKAAAKALTTVDGEVFVDLSKFGQSFKLNADGMKEGISDGIKEMAKSQIEMLDAEIAFLETVVKQEEIFKNLAGEDNQISLGELIDDLFVSGSSGKDLNTGSETYEYLIEHGKEKINVLHYGAITIEQALSMLEEDNKSLKDKEPIIQSLVNFLQSEWAALPKDWSVQGGLLFKNGIQVELPEITFNTEDQNYSEKLKDVLGEGEIYKAIEKFISDTKQNGQTTITLSDIITFADESGFEDSVISALYSLANTATKEINGKEFFFNIDLQTYVSSDGTQYELPDGQIVNSKEEFLQAQTTGGTADYLMTQGVITKVDGQGFTLDGTTFYNTLDEAYNAYYEQKLKETPPELEQGELETEVALTIKSNNISIGQENENGYAVIDINGVEANAKSVIVSVNEDNVEFKDANGNTLTGPEVLAQLNILEAPDADKFTLLQEAIANLQIPEEVFNSLDNFLKAIQEIADAANSIEITGPARVNALAYGIKSIPTERKTIPIELSVSTNGSIDVSTVGGTTGSKGSVANLSFATGNAKATGTLMGELGPELYVTGGRYYVAGQNGAEFVNLPSDAIVFNHLQTEKLLNNGSINGTGKAITNEKKATAMASGNVNGGPAKASASDALAELKEIRALWQGLLDIDAKSLGKKAGGGGGGGGGSNDDNKAFLHDLERWYNLLRQIEKLEQQITYEQAKRANMQSGYSYSDSLEKELELLKKQQKANQQLSALQKDYYDKRRQELLSTDYSKVFTYDEDGLMQYVDGKGRGLDILATLNDTDANGKALMNSSQQLEYLRSVGFDTKVLETNADGTEAESEEQMLQNFWDGVDGWMDELDGLYDSYNDAEIAVQEAIEAQTAILQEYIDNQLSVEGKLLQAIVDREQAEIDRLQDEKDALEEASQAFISGLSDSLNKEKELYDRNEDASETSKLQRQLAILQRSGGSATEIKSLQDQIDSRLQDSYFQAQQDQIDAIEEASNNQLEKLQDQIDLMTETLEYQKANGLLWEEVSTMINSWTPEQMLQFIEEYTSSYKENSALDNEETSKETLKELEILADKRDGEAKNKAWTDYYNGLKDYSEEVKKEHAAGAKAAFDEAYATGGYSAAKAAADAYYKKAIGPSNSSNNSKDNKGQDQNEYPYGKASETTGNIKEGAKGNSVKAIQYALNKLGFGNAGTESVDGIFGSGTTKAVKAFQKASGIAVDGIVGNETRAKFKAKKYKTGGLVDYTGPAWVDGSKSKPEAFLSASDTAMLKSKIFSNSDGSLKTLVAALEEITKNTSHYSTDNSVSEQIIIQSAQVNIQPGVISNDYDARKAGEKALEEMVKIARKTTNRIVSR